MSDVTDHVLPTGRWQFDATVTDAFGDMLERSIPQYDVMRETVVRIGSRFVEPQTDIVDLGCSRGDALAPFVQRFGAYNSYIGVETAPPMLAAARERFDGYIKTKIVSIRDLDLRTAYPPVRASLTLGVLTIQFIPIEHRQSLLRRIFAHTIPGGAFVLVEKVIGSSSELDELLTAEYLALKKRNGYSDEEITRKRLALEGVLVPVTAAWNEDLIRAAGFTQVECIWRWLNFAGWVAVRSKNQ